MSIIKYITFIGVKPNIQSMRKFQIILIILVALFIYSVYSYTMSMDAFFSSIHDESGVNRSYSWINYIYPFLLLFELIGILQFFVSGYRKSIILRLSLLYTLLRFTTVNIYFIFYSDHYYQDIDISFIVNLIYISFHVYTLIILQKSLKPILQLGEDGNSSFEDVNKWKRFFHRLFDLIIIIDLYYFFLQLSPASIWDYDNIETYFIFAESKSYIPLTIFGLFYYLISEGIFNTSIGKTIMGNIVVNSTGEYPSITQRIGRNIARLIPFEPLSLLFSLRSWHDSIPDTYVIKVKSIAKEDNVS